MNMESKRKENTMARTPWKLGDIAKYAAWGDKASKAGTPKAGDEYDKGTYEGLIMLVAMDELENKGYKIIKKFSNTRYFLFVMFFFSFQDSIVTSSPARR